MRFYTKSPTWIKFDLIWKIKSESGSDGQRLSRLFNRHSAPPTLADWQVTASAPWRAPPLRADVHYSNHPVYTSWNGSAWLHWAYKARGHGGSLGGWSCVEPAVTRWALDPPDSSDREGCSAGWHFDTHHSQLGLKPAFTLLAFRKSVWVCVCVSGSVSVCVFLLKLETFFPNNHPPPAWWCLYRLVG